MRRAVPRLRLALMSLILSAVSPLAFAQHELDCPAPVMKNPALLSALTVSSAR